MASLIYNNAVRAVVSGEIDFATDDFYVLLVTSAYSPDKDNDETRADITNEVSGTGYTAGGVVSVATVSQNNANDRVDITFANVSWANATITARACVIYKRVGGAASGDPLVAYVDFGSDVSSTNATFAITFSSALRFQN